MHYATIQLVNVKSGLLRLLCKMFNSCRE